MFQSRIFRVLVGTLLVFLIIFVGSQISFIFKPLVVFFQTLFVPFVIAGVLFYLARPVVNRLQKHRVPCSLAILIVYLAMIGLLILAIIVVGPVLQAQVRNLINDAPKLFEELRLLLAQVEESEWVSRFQQTRNFSIEQITTSLTNFLYNAFNFVTENVAGIVGIVTNIVLTLILIPFILFYLLKDGSRAPDQFVRFLPEKHREEGRRILRDMDEKLKSYIQGIIIVSFCVGVLMYAAFLIIGLNYSLILALVAMLANVVPFLGPWIGAAPAVIVAVLDSPLTFLWVVLAVIVVQQFESNLISPQVMGRKLAIHPLTIIVLIIVAGKFAGVLGLIVAVPLYAVAKVVISHIYRLFQLRKKAENEIKS